jgi:hypothetical protein
MKTASVLLLVLLFGLPLSYGETNSYPNDYAYVAVTYSCSSGKNVAVFSQVFGACYQETNHSAIAIDQRDTYRHIAEAACDGDVDFDSQRSSYPYQGYRGIDTAEYERGKEIRDMVGYGYRVESVYLQTPYSSRCSN